MTGLYAQSARKIADRYYDRFTRSATSNQRFGHRVTKSILGRFTIVKRSYQAVESRSTQCLKLVDGDVLLLDYRAGLC